MHAQLPGQKVEANLHLDTAALVRANRKAIMLYISTKSWVQGFVPVHTFAVLAVHHQSHSW